jgi:hypothetical protein
MVTNWPFNPMRLTAWKMSITLFEKILNFLSLSSNNHIITLTCP